MDHRSPIFGLNMVEMGVGAIKMIIRCLRSPRSDLLPLLYLKPRHFSCKTPQVILNGSIHSLESRVQALFGVRLVHPSTTTYAR